MYPIMLGKTVYVNWPLIHEAKVVTVSNGLFEYRILDFLKPLGPSPPSSIISKTASYIHR